MTRLELVQMLSRKTGINFVGPASTLLQTGKYLQVVEWIDSAYQSIQTLHSTWEFLRKEFSAPLIATQRDYVATTDLSITDWGEWVKDNLFIYLALADESVLTYIAWEDFRQAYGYGTYTTDTGRPTVFTIMPNDKLRFYPIPDVIYTIRGEYFRAPHAMTLDADTPLWAAALHIIVMWRALEVYGSEDAEEAKIFLGKAEYRRMLKAMEKKYLPALTYGSPLA